ncbi:MAG: Fe-S cluster assembly sulfur transfer protein SufU [Elusimicrobiota bacterium]
MSQGKLEGGISGGVEELYREVILDHFKSPKNRGSIENANAVAEGMNPLCGDQLTLSAKIENDKIIDIKFEGHGCAISQSAASMLTQAVRGKNLTDVSELSRLFKNMFGIKEGNKNLDSKISEDDLGDLISLEGVKKYPVRVKCAVLSVNTLKEAINSYLKI